MCVGVYVCRCVCVQVCMCRCVCVHHYAIASCHASIHSFLMQRFCGMCGVRMI